LFPYSPPAEAVLPVSHTGSANIYVFTRKSIVIGMETVGREYVFFLELGKPWKAQGCRTNRN
jgi:hypothetical protein